MMFQEFVSHNGSLELERSGLSCGPIRGLPLTGRDNSLRGCVFDLATSCGVDCGCFLSTLDELEPESVECAASRIGRIGSSIYMAYTATVSGSSVWEEADSSRSYSVLFKLEAATLSCEPVQRELLQASDLLSTVGVRVSVAFTEPPSGGDGFLRSFRAALYVLEDQGIDVFLVGTLTRKFGKKLRNVLERSVSGLMVSPRLLGLGEKYGAYNPVKFEAGVKMLTEAIHEHRKVVVMEDVKTTWQRDVLQTIPFHAFSGSISGSQVIV